MAGVMAVGVSWPFAAILAICIACAALPAVPLGVQLALCVPPIAVFGLPHGATDWALARRMFGVAQPRSWPLTFGAFYALLAALVVFCAWAAPVPALLGFVGLSIWHFGAEDAGSLGLGRGWAPILACGLLPIAAPALFWPSQTAAILGLMGVPVGPGAAVTSGAVAMLLWLACAGNLCLARGRRAYLPEAALLLALNLAAPPLLAFTLYFCALHSPRHLRALPPGLADWRMLPVSVVALAGIAAALWLAGGPGGLATQWAAANGIFWGLACLALPHVVLGRIAAKRGTPGQRSAR